VRRIWLWTLILGMTIAQCGIAARIGLDEAARVVSAFASLEGKGGVRPLSSSQASTAVRILYDRNGETILGYVCELEPQGYVVLGPDTDLVPIIAWSLESAFCWERDPSNVLLDLLQTDLHLRLAALGQGLVSQPQLDKNRRQWLSMQPASPGNEPVPSSEMVGPLIEAPTWAQEAPWNQLCPIDPATGERSDTGCAATALAQILNFWKYPSSVAFAPSDSYVTGTRSLHVDATQADSTGFRYGAKSHHNPGDADMARLSFAAGVSLKMDYTSNGSGAYAIDIAVALAGSTTPATGTRSVRPAVWGFASADIRTCVNSDWGFPFLQTSTAFYDTLKEDLNQGRPAILYVKGLGATTGHILICDGHESSTSRYHLNMGWGGHSDGWYALPEDMPASYSVVEYAVVHIQPGASSATDGASDSGGLSSSGNGAGDFVAYPNPFTEGVTFQYRGDLDGDLSVSVYDLAGRLLWSEERLRVKEIAWDGTSLRDGDLSGGAYIFVITVEDGRDSVTRRGILFKLKRP